MKDFIECGENITDAYSSPERIKAKRKYIWVHGVLFTVAAGNSLGMSGFLGVYLPLVTT